jgi:Na+-transporting NADH:ubiquinone oxidoreductase subunit NqrD
LFLFLLNPFLAWSLSLALLLVPVLAVDTGVCMRFINLSPRDAVLRAFAEGLFWSALILAFALIREPIGNLSLSLPGGSRGIMEFVFNKTLQEDAVRLVSVSAGALILVGYFIVIVRKLLPRGGSHGV